MVRVAVADHPVRIVSSTVLIAVKTIVEGTAGSSRSMAALTANFWPLMARRGGYLYREGPTEDEMDRRKVKKGPRKSSGKRCP